MYYFTTELLRTSDKYVENHSAMYTDKKECEHVYEMRKQYPSSAETVGVFMIEVNSDDGVRNKVIHAAMRAVSSLCDPIERLSDWPWVGTYELVIQVYEKYLSGLPKPPEELQPDTKCYYSGMDGLHMEVGIITKLGNRHFIRTDNGHLLYYVRDIGSNRVVRVVDMQDLYASELDYLKAHARAEIISIDRRMEAIDSAIHSFVVEQETIKIGLKDRLKYLRKIVAECPAPKDPLWGNGGSDDKKSV